jgi:hypothetical protein
MLRAVITRNGNIGGNSYLCTFYVCIVKVPSWASAGGTVGIWKRGGFPMEDTKGRCHNTERQRRSTANPPPVYFQTAPDPPTHGSQSPPDPPLMVAGCAVK